MQSVNAKKPLYFLILPTHQKGSTRELVENVFEFKAKNEVQFQNLLESTEDLIRKTNVALEEGALQTMGQAMSLAHEYLNAIGVSNQALNDRVSACIQLGALGAKLTGAGGGGCVLALFENESQRQIAQGKLKVKGYEAFDATVKC